MATGIKLAVAGVIIAGATAWMAYLGASNSWQYYLTVDECLADVGKLGNARLRVHGTVAEGSLTIPGDRSESLFEMVGDKQQRLAVRCAAPVPDNLKEGIEVVVEGRLDAGQVLVGDRVLTKCASKYQTKESPTGRPPTEMAQEASSAAAVSQAEAPPGERR